MTDSAKLIAELRERADGDDLTTQDQERLLRTADALAALQDDAARYRESLLKLWALWNDPQFCRMKEGYMRGHLSYGNSLNEKEKTIRAVIDEAMK